MSEVRNGAKAVTEIQTELSAEMQRYRELTETVTTVLIYTSCVVVCTCLVIIMRNIADMRHAS